MRLLDGVYRQLTKQERQSLLEQLKLAFDRQFAKRSEALKPYDASQGDLFNEVECEAAKEEEVEVTTTTTTKKRGKRKPLPKTLPREVIELDLDDNEKLCACCKHSLHKIGEDRSEKLEFSTTVLKVLEYVRPKYACRQCEQTEDKSHIVQKPAPQSIIPKSFATESLLASIILGKYQYAMLYSIVETAKANGLILYDYMVKCMKELAKAEPDVDALSYLGTSNINNIAPWVHGAHTKHLRNLG